MSKNQQTLAKIAGGGSLALLVSLSLGQQASALTLVENLSQSRQATGTISSILWQGSNFTTGSGTYNLESATLLFRQNTASSNLFVRLYSNNSGKPGTQITSFTNPASLTTTLANNTFTLTTPQALAPNTTYWLVSEVSSGSGGYSWGNTTSTNQTGLPGWTIGDGHVLSTNQGPWTSFPTSGPYQFSVNEVPEPLTILGTGVVLGAIPVLKKEYGKRKKKKDEDA